MFQGFEVRFYNCRLNVGVCVSWLGFNTAVLLPISFRIKLWISLLLVLVAWLVKSFRKRGRLKVLLFIEPFVEILILYLK
jgi:hypothetical protein